MKSIEIECKVCFKIHGVFDVKEAPKSFVCEQCLTGQHVNDDNSKVGYTKKRVYPEGFWN